MRNAMLAILALSAAGVATMAGRSPAAAYDYPYCLQGRGIGIPGECSYQLWPVHGVGFRTWPVLQRQSARGLGQQQSRRMRVYRDY